MNFQNQINYLPTILDGVIVPEEIDTDILKGEIRLQCGLLRPLYSEPEIMKEAISQWFAARSWTFEHLVNIIKAEYSPIENTDRYDSQTREISGSESGSETGNTSGSETETGSGSHTKETTNTGNLSASETSTGSGQNENTVSAYNAETYQPAVKDENSATNETVKSETESFTGSEGLEETRTASRNSSGTSARRDQRQHNTLETFTQHLHGNIGVTTNQEMINQELDLLHGFNIYQWITFNLRDSLFLEVY